MEERRIQPRAHADWRVKFAVSGEELSNGFLTEVNAAGVGILSRMEYPLGTVIEIHFGAFQEDPEHQFRLRAVVRYAAQGKLGVQFLEGPLADNDRLLRLLRGVF
jgi:hypothetical protein